MKILKAWSNQADGVGHGVPQQRHARGSLYGIAAPVRHCRPRGAPSDRELLDWPRDNPR